MVELNDLQSVLDCLGAANDVAGMFIDFAAAITKVVDRRLVLLYVI